MVPVVGRERLGESPCGVVESVEKLTCLLAGDVSLLTSSIQKKRRKLPHATAVAPYLTQL